MTKKEQLLEQYTNFLKMQNYSSSTLYSYISTIKKFWSFCEERSTDKDFDKANAVQTYLAYRMSVLMLDYSTVNRDYSALQWFYKCILGREWNVNKLKRAHKEKRLPRYIPPEQVARLVEATSCQKHKVLLLTYYSTGMRLSEGRLLKWEDISFEEGVIHIRKGKGAKDRIVILHEELEGILKNYREHLPCDQMYVFSGNDSQRAISSRRVQTVIIKARRKAKLPEWVTTHVLRHSYATTVLKNATDIVTLKEILGHKRLTTTSRYLHLNIRHIKRSHNPLSHECLNVSIQQSQQVSH